VSPPGLAAHLKGHSEEGIGLLYLVIFSIFMVLTWNDSCSLNLLTSFDQYCKLKLSGNVGECNILKNHFCEFSFSKLFTVSVSPVPP
jgi:hypothetical protein